MVACSGGASSYDHGQAALARLTGADRGTSSGGSADDDYMMLSALLLIVFLVHLGAFAYLGLRRRQGYYAALVVTFALLSGATAVRLFAPEAMLSGSLGLAESLRIAAWPAAAVSIGWTLLRIRQRRRRRPMFGNG